MEYITFSENETIAIGKEIGQQLKLGDILALFGGIGHGKTYLTKGIALGLGIKQTELITSPTFKLINEYTGKFKIYHIDLFRLEKETDFFSLGLEEILNDKFSISIIEWPEKIENSLPPHHIRIELKIIDENKRKITIKNLNL